VCEEIASMLSSKGIKNKWKGKNIYNINNKIQHDGFACAMTGHGLKESDSMG
jgi:hypothetical protein